MTTESHAESRRRSRAKWRNKNRLKVREHNRMKARESRMKNPDKYRAIGRLSYHKNKSKHIISNRTRAIAHYQKNRKEKLEYAKQYAAEHRLERRIYNRKRKAKIRGADLQNPKLIEKWESEMRQRKFVRCHWCGTKVNGKEFHLDHVTPLAKGGIHTISNLCTSCPECNLSKNARAISDWISRGQTFLSL